VQRNKIAGEQNAILQVLKCENAELLQNDCVSFQDLNGYVAMNYGWHDFPIKGQCHPSSRSFMLPYRKKEASKPAHFELRVTFPRAGCIELQAIDE
jgi:hypothetical protein